MIGFLRTLRLLRAFRALRMMNKVKGLQQLVISLMNSLASLGNVLGVTLLVWLIFGIFGVSEFKGKFYRCSDVVYGRIDCVGSFVGSAGVVNCPTWTNANANFDNLLNAMFLLYEMSTENDWVVKAHHGMDAVGVDKQPVIEAQAHWSLYFLMFIVTSNFFFMVSRHNFELPIGALVC